MIDALQAENLKENRRQGFFRPEASLGILFVAPKDSGNPGASADSLLAAVERYAPRKDAFAPVKRQDFFGAILPLATPDSPGAILKLIERSEGAYAELESASFEQQLQEMSASLALRLRSITQLRITNPAIVLASIEIRVDGTVVPFELDPETSIITISAQDAIGSKMEIDYCVRKRR